MKEILKTPFFFFPAPYPILPIAVSHMVNSPNGYTGPHPKKKRQNNAPSQEETSVAYGATYRHEHTRNPLASRYSQPLPGVPPKHKSLRPAPEATEGFPQYLLAKTCPTCR